MTRMIHSMIRVADADRSVAFYGHALALTVADTYRFDDFTLYYLRDAEGTFELELTHNHDRTGYTLGDGYGHLAVSVSDLDAEHRRLVEAGLDPTPIRSLDNNGARLARFCFLTDPDGYRIEVLERGGRFL